MKQLILNKKFDVVFKELENGKSVNEINSQHRVAKKVIEDIMFYYHHNLFKNTIGERQLKSRTTPYNEIEEDSVIINETKSINSYSNFFNEEISEDEKIRIILKFNNYKMPIIVKKYAYEELSDIEKQIFKKV